MAELSGLSILCSGWNGDFVVCLQHIHSLWIPNSIAFSPLLYLIAFASYKLFTLIKNCCVKYHAGRRADVWGQNGEDIVKSRGCFMINERGRELLKIHP